MGYCDPTSMLSDSHPPTHLYDYLSEIRWAIFTKFHMESSVKGGLKVHTNSHQVFLNLHHFLGKFSRQQFDIFSYFPQKIGFDICLEMSNPIFGEK